MTKHHDPEDMAEYGEQRYREKKIHWTTLKVIFTLFLFGDSIALIIIGFVPLIDFGVDLKNLANLLFVALHVFYMMSFGGVKRDRQFYFWSTSFLLLDISTLMFYFYEDIFF